MAANRGHAGSSNRRLGQRKPKPRRRLDRDSIERESSRKPLNKQQQRVDQAITEGTRRLLTRAADNRSVKLDSMIPRVRATVEKYLLKHDPEATAEVIGAFVDTLHADDLCLAIACQHGDQAAWSDLVQGYTATVRSAARAASPNAELADDLADSIWGELHGLKARDDGQPAGKLAYYSGAGSLGGWLRAVVGQLAIDRHRREARLVHTEDDADFDRLARDGDTEEDARIFHTTANPEDELVTNLAAATVETALARALGELDNEDRLLVKLYYFDGLRLREAGVVLGFHEATASRRLTRIHADVRKRVENLLMDEHGWTQTEATRSLSEVAASLQMELEPLLTGAPETMLEDARTGGGSVVV